MTLLTDQISKMLKKAPYELNKKERDESLLNICRSQIKFHIKNCDPYKEWYLKNNFKIPDKISDLNEVPFIPSSVFKHLNLKSSNKKSKKISSSGTTSQLKSNVYIDSKTSLNQTSALSKILSSHIGKSRIPFFIIDLEPSKINQNNEMSARYAGMSGYLIAAKKRFYMLKEINGDMVVCKESLKALESATKEGPVVVIGYTYMLWQFINKYKGLNQNIKLHKDSKIIHFGGWKKLSSEKIKKELLNQNISKYFNTEVNNILDIYGFTEQLGTIYVSKGDGGCGITDYSHVIVRDTNSLKEVKDGKYGFLQFISCLPESYPGFSILNDDIGCISHREITNEGREIIHFEVAERLKEAEARGCGDTLPEDYYL